MIPRKIVILCIMLISFALIVFDLRIDTAASALRGSASVWVNDSSAGKGRGSLSSSALWPRASSPSRPQEPPSSPLGEEGTTRKPNDHPDGSADPGLRQAVLLLSSVGRSGSSFLGEVLASQGRNIYFYEPLRVMPERERADRALALAELRRYFHCEIRDEFLGWTKDPHTAARHPVTKGKARGQVSAGDVRRHCRREPLRIVKTIRTRLAWAQELLEDEELRLKVIHLVRDPRGNAVSMAAVNWNKGIADTCSAVLQDLQLKEEMQRKYPDRYFYVKYEEYCVDPYGKTREILRFLRGGDQERDQRRDQERDQRRDQERDQRRDQEWDQTMYQEWGQAGHRFRDEEMEPKRDQVDQEGRTGETEYEEGGQRRNKGGDQREGQPQDPSKALDGRPRPPPTSEDLPASVLHYLDSHIHVQAAAKKTPWTTNRDTSAVHQRWRRKISQAKLTKTEAVCKDVILRLNYRLFGSVARARNMSLSVIDHSWTPSPS
ncbi:uncharacterized protein LOC122254869 [Penaeus japonicus]|uniref:uncharacterized protein LOC122254869 n=1 Tax=Penaeus japonicus TaxID=27405 RepID=UPI001C710097|nr:uncharacterized protein LOC122254869 [Penaeus japonicus]